jgi:hypothetical protein
MSISFGMGCDRSQLASFTTKDLSSLALERDGLVEGGNCFRQPPGFGKLDAEIAVGFGKVGLKCDRFTKQAERLLGLARHAAHVAPMVRDQISRDAGFECGRRMRRVSPFH